MSFLSSLCHKTLSAILSIAFLAESVLLPVAALLPQTARAAGPTLTITPTTLAPGTAFFVTVTGLSPNGFVRVTSLNPKGVISEFTSGMASAYGNFTKSFVTSSWMSGTYKLWADANGQSNIVSFIVTPVLSLSSYNFTAGTSQTITVSNAPSGAEVKIFCRDPNGVVCDDPSSGTADVQGKFSRAYDTTGWTVGNYSGWVTVGGTKSNTVYYYVSNPIVSNNPSIRVSAPSFFVGGSFVKYVSGAAPNVPVRMFSKNPSGAVSEEAAGTTNGFGEFSRSYSTIGWAMGTYETWASVNNVQSNVTTYTINAPPTTLTVSPATFTAGASATISIVNAALNATVSVFCRDPNNVVCDDPVSYTTNSNGQFSHTYNTTGWTVGNYSGWVTVGGTKSNTVYFTVTSAPTVGTQPSITFSNADTKINPSPIVLGQEVRFSTKLTVSSATAQNFQIKLDASDSLQLRSAYRDTNCSTSPLSDPLRPTPTRAGTKAYLWPADYFSGGIAPGTYDFCFKFQAPTNTSQSSASFYFDASSVTPTYNVTANATSVAAFSAPATVPTYITIYRSPATSPTNPYKIGDATVSSSVNSPSFFTTDYTGTEYNQIGANAPRTFTFSTRQLVNNGSCNASTGTCSIPGNWSATDLVCPSGITGVQQMTEWYTIGNTTSNKLTWYFECSATNVSTSHTPVGSLGNIDASGVATGWATDPDSPSTPISVHLYIGGAAGAGGTYAGSAVANLANAAANSAGYAGSHGYSFSIPSQWRDGQPHTLYVHGIDLSGVGTQNVLLSDVPKSFTLGTTSGSNDPALSVSPTAFTASSPLTISVVDAASNGALKVFCRDPNGAVCNDPAGYTTNASGQFTHTYDTTGWKEGTYSEWVTVDSAQSNIATFVVTASTTTATIPETTLSSYNFSAGTQVIVYVSGVPDGAVSTFCIDPNSVQCQDTNAGTTDASGKFSKTYETTGWTIGSYTGWATVNGTKSNIVSYEVTATTTSPGGRPAPTPTTAPMATLTLEREQEHVLPSQSVAFSGTLDASQVAFPQGSALFIAVPEKTSIERIEIDDRALGAGEFTLNNGNAKIQFPQALYNGSHPFRIVLRNEVSLVPQLDRNVAVWVSVIGPDSKLLLKGRTASTMVAHLPTEIIGRGVSLSVPRTVTGWIPGGPHCCWASTRIPFLEPGIPTIPGSYLGPKDVQHFRFPIRKFSFSEIDVTRGPLFTPNQVPLLPENVAFTLLPGDATMQRTGLSLKQFSDALAREFITANYQYILGRDPSNEEMSRYLPRFTQWRNPLANLAEVYNRRADVQQLVLVPRDKNIGGSNSGSPLPSWDKLLEWVRAHGWREEPTLASFKPQTSFDEGWRPFKELWEKFTRAYANAYYGTDSIIQYDTSGNLVRSYETFAEEMADINPVAAIAYLCSRSNGVRNHASARLEDPIDFEFCWKNDPMVRNYAILWAKDAGWAYNDFLVDIPSGADASASTFYPVLKTINPSGPILAPMFGPGKYPEFAEEQQWRYPPAQLYYDLISSSEYASSIEQRFRTNIDSVIRLFFGRAATESDIEWAKDKFISGGIKKSIEYGRHSWVTPQWEPNGALIASNFDYVDDAEFVKNPRYFTDGVYGIRNIQMEVDAVSSRLIEMIEKYGRQELYQGDSFKHIVSGLYRLYVRRDPTGAELENHRTSGKDFGDIEFKLNQSKEYGKDPASDTSIKNLYRNYLGRDPNDADISQWGDKTISTIANKIGKSEELKAYAQQHPENAYIFPVKKIKIVKCGFFCSVAKMLKTAVKMVFSTQVGLLNMVVNPLQEHPGAKPAMSLMELILRSLSYGFNKTGFNGETFVEKVSIARAMAGQAGGVFSMTNVFENADPTILNGFRTMARAPQTSGSAFAQTGQSYLGLASPLGAVAGLFGASAPAKRIAQIDISSHYGSGMVAAVKNSTGTAKTVTAKAQFTKTLKQGSRGAEVLRLQKLLGEADLAFLPEHQTGYYGAKTVAAVKRFQKRNGLEQTGRVGAKTRMLLNSIVR